MPLATCPLPLVIPRPVYLAIYCVASAVSCTLQRLEFYLDLYFHVFVSSFWPLNFVQLEDGMLLTF